MLFCPNGYEGTYCQLIVGTLDGDAPVTWSPPGECQARPAASPNANGEWDGKWEHAGKREHATSNPKFQVPGNYDSREGGSSKGGANNPVLALGFTVTWRWTHQW